MNNQPNNNNTKATNYHQKAYNLNLNNLNQESFNHFLSMNDADQSME